MRRQNPLPAQFQGRDLLAEGVLTPKQTYEFVQVARATLYRWMDRSLLPFKPLPRRGRRIGKVALRIFLAMRPNPLPPQYQGRDLIAEGVLTLKQACEFLQVGRSSLYRWMNDGLLPYAPLPVKGRRIGKVTLKIFLCGSHFR